LRGGRPENVKGVIFINGKSDEIPTKKEMGGVVVLDVVKGGESIELGVGSGGGV